MSDQILDYMLMSGNSYDSTRSLANKIPVPSGWAELSRVIPRPSGFEASTYRQGNQIVIAFAGTYPGRTSSALIPEDLTADGSLGLGFCHDQLKDAALYYMQIKATNPTAQITFTGHSLGGGLAALMGCFFNRPAYTFDQAPFRRAATETNRDILASYLQGQGFAQSDLADLLGFTSWTTLNTFVNNIRGVAGVQDWHVQGEFLTPAPNGLVETLALEALGIGRIGSSTQISQGADYPLSGIATGNQISNFDAHAIELVPDRKPLFFRKSPSRRPATGTANLRFRG